MACHPDPRYIVPQRSLAAVVAGIDSHLNTELQLQFRYGDLKHPYVPHPLHIPPVWRTTRLVALRTCPWADPHWMCHNLSPNPMYRILDQWATIQVKIPIEINTVPGSWEWKMMRRMKMRHLMWGMGDFLCWKITTSLILTTWVSICSAHIIRCPCCRQSLTGSR